MIERLRRAGEKNLELSRWNLARTLLTEDRGALLRGIADDHKLRVYFLTGMRPCRQPDVPGVVAEIGSACPRASRRGWATGCAPCWTICAGPRPRHRAVDRRHQHRRPEPQRRAQLCRRRGVPLFPIGLGSEQPLRDLKLSDLLVDDVVFVNDVVNFECQLSSAGYEGRKVAVVLREKQKRPSWPRWKWTVGPDQQPQTVRIPFRPTRSASSSSSWKSSRNPTSFRRRTTG